MKFYNVRLLVRDFPASLKFWRDVMKFPMTYGDEAMGYAYFDTGSAGVELFTQDGFAAALGEATPAPTPTGRQTVLVFEVENVDTAYTDLVERGAQSVAKPQDRAAWGVRSGHLSDPDGQIIEIYSKLG